MKPENFPSQPQKLWNVFYDFTQTPRPSRFEEKIRAYLINLAQENEIDYKVDGAGNIIMYVPGKNGRESDEPLLIQNHIDMVTDALPDRTINFQIDPIETRVEGEWLKAVGTTLGADNGIGCAAALACILDKDMVHPPLELLFTVDEETGLNGALGLEAKYLKARKMLNLDTEEWGSLYIGCAGGIDYELTADFDLLDSRFENFYRLDVKGFVGGHSGVDIHEQRGNAIKFLAEILGEIEDFDLAEIRAGKAHNIIPRDGFAIISMDSNKLNQAQEIAEKVKEKWLSFSPENDQNFSFTFTEVDGLQVVAQNLKQNLLKLFVLFPHGVHSYNSLSEKLAGVSNNFARLLLVRGKFYIQTSLRFFDREEVKTLENQIQTLGNLFDLKVENHSEYPSWKPARHNPLLEKVKAIYQNLYNESPEVKAIHAGLECGILRDKIGEIDVVSFGPTIMGAHSPDERVHIPSVESFWQLFKEVLKTI